MRDYLRQKVLEHKDEVRDAIDSVVATRQRETAAHQLNSKRGSITGEGSVTGSYILGSVQIAKGSHLSNSIVDSDVTLIIDEDVNITDCSFHGYMRQFKSDCVPTTIHIKKGCKMARVWFSMSAEIGENSRVMWACFNCNRQDYEVYDQPNPAIIGENAVIYNGYIDAANRYKGSEEESHGGCTIGKNLFMFSGRLVADGGQATIGDDFLVCNDNEAWALIRNTFTASFGRPEVPVIEDVRNRCDCMDGIGMFGADLNVGNNGSVFLMISFAHAYEKLKDRSTFTFGDNVIIIAGSTAHHSSSTPNILAHDFKVGNDVTMCVTGDGWYANNSPYRTVDIGDNSLIRLQVRRDGQLVGPDVKTPRDAVVVL